MEFFDIHRHDEYSLFDGMGSAKQVAEYAKQLGYPAVGLTNHGNITGLIKHFTQCEKYGIIPILGVEGYFQPNISNDKKSYHICLFANSMTGWENLNKLITRANSDGNFYYKPRLSFKDLEEYSEGIVCSSACIAGFIPQALLKDNVKAAEKAANKFKSIFGKRFFIEIQPIELREESEKGKENTQIKINEKLFELAEKLDIQVIATTDSHYIKKEDFPTYLKMHEIKKSKYGDGYQERYMPTKEEMTKRIKKYHPNKLDSVEKGMKRFLKVIGDSREWLTFEPNMPQFTDDTEETFRIMKNRCIKKLKSEGKFSKKYQDRLKYEFDVIRYHGFQDYFMIVQEYVNWAKNNDVAVGPGRGSAGNSLTNYALGITDVDPVYFKNDFDRFLRKDKKKFPDIDVDFGQDKRDQVISHIIKKYSGMAAQTLTYGCYNVKNLINDLVKVCGVDDKIEIEEMKKHLHKYCNDNESIIDEDLYDQKMTKVYNAKYNNIITHFSKLYGKVRYFSTHASSVILCNDDISSHVGLIRIGGNLRTSFDLKDIDTIKLLKLDILGLSSASKVHELMKMTDEHFSYKMLEDKLALKKFEEGNACVFQFESKSANDIAQIIGIDSFEDIVVATSVNRPGPLSLQMHEKYRDAKISQNEESPWYKFTKQTYGTLIYQEQGMSICKNIGGLDADTTDKLVKTDFVHIPSDQLKEWHKQFKRGALKYGLNKDQIEEIFNLLAQYSFNRGHGVAYAMISVQLMYFRTHYPLEFWYATLKYESNEDKMFNQESSAINDGCLIFLPHVNGEANFSLTEYDGEKVIQKGLTTIKNVGQKAAESIVNERKANGKFTDLDEFIYRCKSRSVTSRVLDALEDAGALCFNQKKFLKQVENYNVKILAKGNRQRF